MAVVPHPSVGSWETEFASLEVEWRLAKQAIPASWEAGYAEAEKAMATLVEARLWMSGPSTLLEVLGLQGLETVHTRCLAWLLDPKGTHGLGRTLLEALGLGSAEGPSLPDLSFEERCQHGSSTGRVDLVIREGETTTVVEVKLWAGIHGDQLDLYSAAYPDAQLVFLTRNGSRPSRSDTADPERWRTLSWTTDVLPAIGAAIEDLRAADRTPPGLLAAEDYFKTLKRELAS